MVPRAGILFRIAFLVPSSAGVLICIVLSVARSACVIINIYNNDCKQQMISWLRHVPSIVFRQAWLHHIQSLDSVLLMIPSVGFFFSNDLLVALSSGVLLCLAAFMLIVLPGVILSLILATISNT